MLGKKEPCNGRKLDLKKKHFKRLQFFKTAFNSAFNSAF